jgi:uncharacterized protein (DUF58 family)
LFADSGHPPAVGFDVPTRDTHCVSLAVPTRQRGWLECPPLMLVSHYPLGITRAWTRRVRLPARCLVYPDPASADALPPMADASGDGERGPLQTSEDFGGLRAYQTGDAPSHISWKTLARGQGLYTKDFRAPGTISLWLDWQVFVAPSVEQRLSLLTRAVLDADAAGLQYGLRLPTLAIPPAHGPSHRAACLEALALYEADRVS